MKKSFFGAIALTAVMLLNACTAKGTTVVINAQNTSGQSGTAVFTELDGKVHVSVTLPGGAQKVPQPIHLHAGTCEKLGDIKQSLNDIVNGKSETDLNITMADLKAQMPMVINAHKSYEDVKTYVACGNVAL